MIDAVARKRANVRAEAEKGKTAGLIASAAKEPGAVKLPSGMVIKTTRPGTGAQPEAAAASTKATQTKSDPWRDKAPGP